MARVDSGNALNGRAGTYRVADVKVTLVKVVSPLMRGVEPFGLLSV